MAAVTICDRCGGIYNKDDGFVFEKDWDNPFSCIRIYGCRDKKIRAIDLCNNCLKEFLTWIDGDIDTGKE